MRKIILMLFAIALVTGIAYSQPETGIANYQRQYMKSATSANDTTLFEGLRWVKFTVAPIETDSVIHWSLSGFSSTDSMSLTTPQVWNQPEWLDAFIFDKIIIKGASDYILTVTGIRKP